MNKALRLLLVDDDADDREFFAHAIAEIDPAITCVPARDGREGLVYLQDKANSLPDFIFLDLRMPGMSGRSFLNTVRADNRLRDIPTIIYSTSSDELDAEELLTMGARHFATKPSNPEEIYYILSMILNEKW